MISGMGPEFVFPFRPEMLKVFDWASRSTGSGTGDSTGENWKLNYYKALILWRHAGKDKAKEKYI